MSNKKRLLEVMQKVNPSFEPLNEGDDKWIQKAVDPAHKGDCTPMTKDTCTPRRKALAKRFKAGIEDESVMEAFVGDNPEEYRIMVEKLKASMDKLFQEEHFDVIDTLYRLIVERKRPVAPELTEHGGGAAGLMQWANSEDWERDIAPANHEQFKQQAAEAGMSPKQLYAQMKAEEKQDNSSI